MFSLKKFVVGAATALGILSGATAANAASINVLYLSIDGSGSINNTNFDLQKNAYISVLNSLIPTDGSIAIGINQFGANVEEVFALTLIDSQAAHDAMMAAITGMTRVANTGATNTNGALIMARDAIAGSAFACTTADVNCVVDVSTDGAWNQGGDPAAVVAELLNTYGTVVNCLAVGPSASCDFESGFETSAASFADFETALERKILTETGRGVPAPAALLLIGFGLAAMGGARMRKRA